MWADYSNPLSRNGYYMAIQKKGTRYFFCNFLSIIILYGISKEMKSFTPVQTTMKHGLKDIQVNLTYLITARAKLN